MPLNPSKATGQVYSLAFDRGILYVAAENGLFKVLGTQVERLHSLDSTSSMGIIRQMEISQDGKIWMLRQGDGVHSYNPSNRFLSRVDLPAATASSAVHFGISQSGLVVATANDVSWWSFSGILSQQIKRIEGRSLRKISALTVTAEGEVWFADQYNLYHVSTTMKITRTLLTKVFPGLVRMTALYNHKDRLYALGWNGLYELSNDGEAALFYPFPIDEPQPVRRGDIRFDSEDNVWVAANNLYFLDRTQGGLISAPFQQPLLKPQYMGRVTAIDTSDRGELVVASVRRGVFAMPNSVRAINYLHHRERVAQQTIRQVFMLDGQTGIVRDEQRAYKLDTTSGRLEALQSEYLNHAKQIIPLPNGRALVVDRCTLLSFEGAHPIHQELPKERCYGFTSLYSQASTNTLVHRILEERHEIVWLDQDAVVQRRASIDITPIALQSYGNELAVIAGDNNVIAWQTDSGWQTELITKASMTSMQCMSVHESVLSLCIAGQGELQLDLASGRWLTESKWEHGSMFVRDVYQDIEGNRWHITNLGLQLYLRESSTFHLLNSFAGVFDVDFAPDGIIPLSDSKILVLGAQQHYLINTRSLVKALTKRQSKSTVVSYSSLSFDVVSAFRSSVDTETYYLDGRGMQRLSVDVPYSASRLVIGFQQPMLPGENGSQLEYNMSGIQDYWTPLNSLAKSLQFAELPIGQHRLQIRVRNPNRSVDQPISELVIKVSPPFWLTTTAYVAYLVLLLSITGYFVIRLKRQLERDKAHLEALVRAKNQALVKGQQSIRHLLDRRETLLSELAFELRGPLQNIDEPLDHIRQHSDSSTTQARLDIIQRNTHKMRQLITQLTELERLEASKFLPKLGYDVDSTLSETVDGYLNLNMLPASKINIGGARGLKFTCLANSLDKIIYGLLDYVIANVALNNAINVTVAGDQFYFALSVAVQHRSVGEPCVGETFVRDDAEAAEVSLALVSKLVSANHGRLKMQSNGHGIEISVKFRVSHESTCGNDDSASNAPAELHCAAVAADAEVNSAHDVPNESPIAMPDFCSVKQRQFFNEFVILLEQHYKDTSFNRARAAHCLALSERQLNRRLAEFNLGNFNLLLRQFRLHKGRRLIESGHQITRVSFEVGFSDAGYFSQRFKQEYGCSPTDYARHFEVTD